MSATDLTRSETHFAIAGTLLAGAAGRDSDRFADAFEPELAAIALLPGGVYQWPDRAAVRSVFDGWFGDLDDYELTDFAVTRIGKRMHVRWRVAVSGGHLGDARYAVEQQLYADTGPTGRIGKLSFICSGFCRERTGG